MTKASQVIVPSLWFDTEAFEAAEFYTSIFPNSKITNKMTLPDTPSGDADLVSFQLCGYDFTAISGGPYFTANSLISFMVRFKLSEDPKAQKISELWDALKKGGKVETPLETTSFSEKYGVVQDRYGFTWQLILVDEEEVEEEKPAMIPSILFSGEQFGKAEEAMRLYTSIFKNSQIGEVSHFPVEGKAGEVNGVYAEFKIENQWFAVMDDEEEHDYKFNEAISLMVKCEDQNELDDYWDKLSAFPESEQCGWLQDKFGLSWQIIAKDMDKMESETSSPEQIKRYMEALLKMKKLDIAKLWAAYNNE
ncbi:VOC family protein [Marinilactibacillus sp. GCM10026970]|uniref:VOC family protein n=1 Tax=Marinilactibacillus sp. GCM10026970 TaxID=3252642 RepID=UPI00361EC060